MTIKIDVDNLKGPSFNMNPQLESEQEKTRLEYQPKKIRFLFIGESMPAGGTFFYFENSNLYRYTKEVFLQNFDWPEKDFLKFFKSNGFYLDDLCLEPIDDFDDTKKRKARKAYEQNLTERLKLYNPKVIISTPMSIGKNITAAMKKSGLTINNYSLPFPAQGNQRRYAIELSEIIKKVIRP